MKRVVMIVILAAAYVSVAQAVEPANRKSNPQVKKVLEYFYSLSDKSENRILSGQFTNFGTGSNLKIMEQIHDATGQWPALMGTDYADFRRGSITTKVPNTAAIEYWKQGGLVHVMAHMYNPANPQGGGLRDKGVDIADVLRKDTDTHRRWMEQLDLIADGLLELKEAGVVVLWRPFHEMNGGWFWWGAQKPESFIAVWRHMFEYYSNVKNLDNLLWVYGPNHGDKTAAYYAGDKYVDLIGLDAYTDFLDPKHVRGYAEIVALNKPFGFSEYGPHASSNPPGDYDYRNFLEGVKKNFPRTCYFMSWNAKWSLASNRYVKEMLNDPAVANRDDLPKELFSAVKSSAVAVEAGSIPPVEGHWKLTFEDHFNGDTLDSSKWIPSYEWGQTHNYNAYCDPANVLIENSLLRLRVEDKPSHGKKYTSAVVTTYNKFSQQYGYFEGRFRIPSGKGFWPAFWMLPYPQHWPPEIDLFETIRDDPKVYMTYHWSEAGKHKSSGKNWTDKDFTYSGDFHTYGLLWEPDRIVWYIDGIERARFADAGVIVNEPMYLLINFGIDAQWPGPCDQTTSFPAYYECAWVRVYAKAETQEK
ncbi:MAG: family 16 glycosylhydrolase [Sedimentisphaerales bacterium]|nr:family 16 glycosylhydrolase [Sedimentisphaerales bacterium]